MPHLDFFFMQMLRAMQRMHKVLDKANTSVYPAIRTSSNSNYKINAECYDLYKAG